MTRICVVVTARPSWAKLQPICEALRAMPDVELQIVACASALLERYGRVVDVIKAQGFSIAAECFSVIEGESTLTGAQETGGLLNLLAPTMSRLQSDLVVGCADRREILAVAQAAAYQHIPFGHVQGGERTGSIDDRVRDSVGALADYHFPATARAALRVWSLTGSDRIYNCGCPSIDLAKRAQDEPPVTTEELGGSGPSLDLQQPFLLVLQHPVTNEAADAYHQMEETLAACAAISLPRIVFWPGEDAGRAGIEKQIRVWKERHQEQVWRTVRNLPPTRFLRLLTQCAVLVGNSSAGIRESAYLGVPVVDIGHRQHGRERASNAVWAPHEREAIAWAIRRQRIHGRYASSALYGDGHAGQKIAEKLRDVANDRTGAGAHRQPGHPEQKLS